MKKNICILAVCLLLAACAEGEKPKPEKDIPAPPSTSAVRVEKLICPQVAILREAQETFEYGVAATEPANLIAKARMDRISGDCAYRDGDKKGKGSGIDISFEVHGVAERGAGLKDGSVKLPYFIAIVDPADNILARQLLDRTVDFKAAKSTVVWSEPVHVFVPVQKDALISGPDYRVLVGFKNVAVKSTGG